VLEKPVKMRIPAGFRWLAALTLAAQFLVVTLKYLGGTSELSTRDPFWEFNVNVTFGTFRMPVPSR